MKDRNAIAHGEKRYTEIDESVKIKIDNNSEKILTLIHEVKKNILIKAEEYKKVEL